jgi:hypothetical protein
MSTTYTQNTGLGIPSLDDASYVSTISTNLSTLDAQSAIGMFGVSRTENPSTTLNVRINGGSFRKADGTVVTVSTVASQAMTANQTNYVYLTNTGTVTVNTTGFPAATDIVRVATVVASGTNITSITDARLPFVAFGAALTSTFLPLAGGTMTGLLTLGGTGNNSGTVYTATAAPGAPSDGQVYYNSTQKALVAQVDGMAQVQPGVMFTQTAGVTVANTTTETTLLGGGIGTLTLPVNSLVIGKTVRIRAAGKVSTTGTPTLLFNFKLGATVIVTTGAVATGSGLANAGWNLDLVMTCRTTGGTGTVIADGTANVSTTVEPLVSTATTTIDTTATQAISVTATWGTAAAGNTITCDAFSIEVLN